MHVVSLRSHLYNHNELMRCLRESHVKLSSIVSFFEMVYVVFERASIKLQHFYNILDSKHRYWVELFDMYLLYDA